MLQSVLNTTLKFKLFKFQIPKFPKFPTSKFKIPEFWISKFQFPNSTFPNFRILNFQFQNSRIPKFESYKYPKFIGNHTGYPVRSADRGARNRISWSMDARIRSRCRDQLYRSNYLSRSQFSPPSFMIPSASDSHHGLSQRNFAASFSMTIQDFIASNEASNLFAVTDNKLCSQENTKYFDLR